MSSQNLRRSSQEDDNEDYELDPPVGRVMARAVPAAPLDVAWEAALGMQTVNKGQTLN
jgi:hypothetical protein